MPIEVDASEADPVVAEYNVFLKPQLPAHQRLLVMQYPNRIDKNGGVGGGAGGGVPQTPTELRIKSGSGMIEVDVPLDYSTAYDRAKGVAWGSALAASTKAKAGGSHGLAGGFGVGAQTNQRGGGRGAAAAAAAGSATIDDTPTARAVASSSDWAEAVRQDRVLRLQTLGGMCPPTRGAEATWMIGVFDGGNVHLTPVSSIVHLRPQLHHIDAETEVERSKHRDGADGGGGGGAATGRGAQGPRAIHMTVKSAGGDGEELITETMADRLRAVQMQDWSRMVYVGDDDEHSWDVYDQTLFLKDPNPATTPASDKNDKGKAPAASGAPSKDTASLAGRVPALRTAWDEGDMLVAISKIAKPAGADDDDDDVIAKIEARPKGKNKVTFSEPESAAGATAATDAVSATLEVKMEDAPRRTRPVARPAASMAAAGSGAPATSRARSARTRQAPSKGAAMDIDP